jgi:hypothetical protein
MRGSVQAFLIYTTRPFAQYRWLQRGGLQARVSHYGVLIGAFRTGTAERKMMIRLFDEMQDAGIVVRIMPQIMPQKLSHNASLSKPEHRKLES